MEQSQVGLALEGVTVDYGAAKPALDNVTVSLKGGRIVGLLGANGAGKTTFINACAGVRTATPVPAYGQRRLCRRTDSDIR